MEKYQQYKDSGVSWLGSIPAHWEVRRLGSYFEERKTKVSDKDFEPLSVTKLGVFPQWENVAKSNDGDNRKLVKKGDFVINSRSDRKGSSGLSELEGSVSLINIVLKPRTDINRKYCHYLLKSQNFIEEFYRNGHGIVADLWTTRYDEMKAIKIAMPTKDEQDAIVSYLDSATGEIDKAIAQQQKMIDLLNERKRIIINNAVTKGLDPNAPMKDSGDLLDFIPAHWKWERLKYNCSIWGRIGFRGYSNEDLVDELSGAITLSPTNIIDGKINYEKCSYLSWKKYYESPEIMVKVGDVIFVKTASVGKSAYIDWMPKETTVNPQIAVFKDIKCNSIFFSWVLQTDYLLEQVENSKAGSTIFTISQEKIGNYKLCLPPRDEQDAIVEYLKEKTESIDHAILLRRNMISILKERKQIIINEAVTGKIKI